ncbi:MAG: hypothetical protein PHS64_01940, partial [Candidatus Omnitrophica bacterium]|nr:hypothetical protein [Candidatus Omnitrophota bacterium]
MPRKIIAFIICFCLVFEQAGFAQVAPQLGVPAYLQNIAPVADKFRPIHLRSLSFDQATNDFNLLLDKGDAKSLQKPQIEETTKKLLEYFKIGLTLPNSMFWVNLRPDAPRDIIDPYVEQTDLGRILLEADLQLKKDMARFTAPATPEGKQYWDKLYQKAESLYGMQDMEIPTITRPWIVPGEIVIGEAKDQAYIYKATLKVMLEQDYLKDTTFYNFDDERAKQLNDYSSQILRELIIPKLTREVNASKRYAALRQVYYSLVLAQWFKQRYRNANNSYASRIDTKDLTGLTSATKWSKDKYYQAYKKSFSQGEYNQQETICTPYGQTIRSYFSGGLYLATEPGIGNNSSPVTTTVLPAPDGNGIGVSAAADGGITVNASKPEERSPLRHATEAQKDGGNTKNLSIAVFRQKLDASMKRFFRKIPADVLENMDRYARAIEDKTPSELNEDANRKARRLNEALLNNDKKRLSVIQDPNSKVRLEDMEQQYRDFIISHILAQKFPELADFNPFPVIKSVNARFSKEDFFSSNIFVRERALSGVPILVLYDPETTVAYAAPMDMMAYREGDVFTYTLEDVLETIKDEKIRQRLVLRVAWGNGEGMRGFFLVEDIKDMSGKIVSREAVDFKGYTLVKIDPGTRHRNSDSYDPSMTLSKAAGETEAASLADMRDSRVYAGYTTTMRIQEQEQEYEYGQLFRRKNRNSKSKLPYAGGVLRLTDLGSLTEKEAEEHHIENILRFLTTPEEFETLFPRAKGGFTVDRLLELVGENIGQQLEELHARSVFNIGWTITRGRVGPESELHVGNIDMFGNILDRTLGNKYEDQRQEFTAQDLRTIDIERMLVGKEMGPGAADMGFLGYTPDMRVREAFLLGLLRGYLGSTDIDAEQYIDVLASLHPVYKWLMAVVKNLPSGLQFLCGWILPNYYYFWEKARSRYTLPRRMAETFDRSGTIHMQGKLGRPPAQKDGGDGKSSLAPSDREDIMNSFQNALRAPDLKQYVTAQKIKTRYRITTEDIAAYLNDFIDHGIINIEKHSAGRVPPYLSRYDPPEITITVKEDFFRYGDIKSEKIFMLLVHALRNFSGQDVLFVTGQYKLWIPGRSGAKGESTNAYDAHNDMLYHAFGHDPYDTAHPERYARENAKEWSFYEPFAGLDPRPEGLIEKAQHFLSELIFERAVYLLTGEKRTEGGKEGKKRRYWQWFSRGYISGMD